MSLVFQRDLPAGTAGTHAYVIGVGVYPDAKPGKGVNPDLRAVPNLPSAADSAKRMCDWLMDNRDRLGAPLASIEMLIGEAAHTDGVTPYDWKNRSSTPVDAPTVQAVESAGLDWLDRLNQRDGETAFFFACGHGARLGNDPVLLLQDINTKAADPWGGFLNVGEAAGGFKQQTKIRSAFFFLDACQEFSAKFELSKAKWVPQFVKPWDPFLANISREKVFLLSASAPGMKAFDGPAADGTTARLGRFTRTLCTALDGASVRSRSGRWIADPHCVYEDIKQLYGVHDWQDLEEQLPFDPTQSAFPNDIYPIVQPANPVVPVRVTTDPAQRNLDYDLRIFGNPDREQPCLQQRPSRAATAWLAWLPASKMAHFAVAEDGETYHQEMFNPDGPIFEHRIPIT